MVRGAWCVVQYVVRTVLYRIALSSPQSSARTRVSRSGQGRYPAVRANTRSPGVLAILRILGVGWIVRAAYSGLYEVPVRQEEPAGRCGRCGCCGHPKAGYPPETPPSSTGGKDPPLLDSWTIEGNFGERCGHSSWYRTPLQTIDHITVLLRGI